MQLLLIFCLTIALTNAQSQSEPCEYKDDHPNAVCPPCLQDIWLDLVKPPPPSSEAVTDPDKKCFNKDPVKVQHLDPQAATVENENLLASGEFKYSSVLGPLGFVIRKHAFFRYAYAPNNNNATGPLELPYWDLDKVKKYFVREEVPGVSPAEDADIQLLEWPGRESSEENENQNPNLPEDCDKIPTIINDPRCVNPSNWMLEFDRDNGKVQHYPCNAQEGTDIVAVASVMQITDEDRKTIDPFTESEQKIWLSSGQNSIFKDYLQPLHLPLRILLEMAKPDGQLCSAKEVDCISQLARTTDCMERCEELKAEDYVFSRNNGSCFTHIRNSSDPSKKLTYGDLRTVTDFTFTRMRLILAMRCGIVVITNILTNRLGYHVSVLQSEDGLKKQFPDPVNKISASTCCSRSEDCHKDDSIVAAYSFQQHRSDNENKFLHVSFNLGDTFEKRIIATPYSPVNLIKGLYKMYARWHHYYEILTNPDKKDLAEDDGMIKDLRSSPIWASSTIAEKEILFSVGKPSRLKRKTIFRTIQDILEDRVPKRQKRLNTNPKSDDLTPDWANEILNKRRREHGWQDEWDDENCDEIPECMKKFENDKAIEWLFNKSDIPIHVKTAKRNEDEPFCKEIASILILPEKKHIMALCEIKFQSSLDDSKNFTFTDPPDTNYFALYSFPIKENIPLIYGERVSKRIFSCKYIKVEDGNPKRLIQPEVVRMPGSATIFIINCDGALYMSTNFGKTLFNAVFYYDDQDINKYCQQNPNYMTPVGQERVCKEKRDLASLVPLPGPGPPPPPVMSFRRSFQLCALDTPPLLITDLSGTILLLTFGRFYARGVISYNKELKIIVGEAVSSEISGAAAIPEFQWTDRFRNLVFPTLNTNGEAILTIALVQAYSISSHRCVDAMRLIPMPLQNHRVVKNFYKENLALCQRAFRKKLAFERCQTNSFFIQPKKVSIKDENTLLPLWLFSSDENSVGLKVTLNPESDKTLNFHSWKLDVEAKPNFKNAEEAEALVDAFFGSDYNKLHDYSTQITVVNLPTIRCHVQPSSTLPAEIGCSGKRLVAHEDAHRPQCKTFRSNFNYTLKRGTFDPDLANRWLQLDNELKRQFLKLTDTGDLQILYDYSRWGCPIEPFRNDPFIPDLRIIDETSSNDTSKGKLFEGKFILIEIFGASGFSYSHKVGNKYTNCKRKPQDLNDLLTRWKYRQRLFELAAKRLHFPTKDSGEEPNDVEGNRCFPNDAVKEHVNIWNRANYESCENPTTIPSQMLTDEIREREYQVMKTRPLEQESDLSDAFITLDDDKFLDEEDHAVINTKCTLSLLLGLKAEIPDDTLNKIEWSRNHQRVYIFLAIAVDGYGSLCNYQTIFGVSLNTNSQMDNLLSFLIFLAFWICWILLVVGGYYVRKRYLRISYLNQARADKLEEAAWKIVYRYEKLIHGKELGHLMHMNPDEEDKARTAGNTYAARTAHDKRKAELRMKKTHIMAQEQARHERLQKIISETVITYYIV